MIRMVSLVCFIILFGMHSLAKDMCFLAKENDRVLKQEGNCNVRYAPQSTFKIALALMGYDSKILTDKNSPAFLCKEDYDVFINVCKGEHTPKTWMRDSCVWYSRIITSKLGIDRFRGYVINFNYGNQDISGDKRENNALTGSWLSSSLQISPEEQVEFLQRLLDHKLAVTKEAIAMTKNIMFIQELQGGWKLYGKTGNGRQLDKNGQKTYLQHGWFVGWIEKNGRVIIFATHITDDKKQDTFASFRARNEALIKLWYLIDGLEK